MEREEWKQKKKTIEKRLENLDWINEVAERKSKKWNIIIKKMNWEKKATEQEVEKAIEEKLKFKVEIKKKVGEIKISEKKKWVTAELDSWEQNGEIIRRKKDLEKGIIIEDDMTRKKREIQNRLKSLAKEERENGNKNVRIGYKKIYMNKR